MFPRGQIAVRLGKGCDLFLVERVHVEGIRGGNWFGYFDKRHDEHTESEANEHANPARDEKVSHTRFLPPKDRRKTALILFNALRAEGQAFLTVGDPRAGVRGGPEARDDDVAATGGEGSDGASRNTTSAEEDPDAHSCLRSPPRERAAATISG